MGPLEFSAGSHKINEGRELSISDESEKVIHERLRVTDFNHIIEPFDIGEVSFHSGWVFHRAGANKSNQIRKVMTIIYMDSKMKLKKPENDGQQNDWETWCPNAKIGQIIKRGDWIGEIGGYNGIPYNYFCNSHNFWSFGRIFG